MSVFVHCMVNTGLGLCYWKKYNLLLVRISSCREKPIHLGDGSFYTTPYILLLQQPSGSGACKTGTVVLSYAQATNLWNVLPYVSPEIPHKRTYC